MQVINMNTATIRPQLNPGDALLHRGPDSDAWTRDSDWMAWKSRQLQRDAWSAARTEMVYRWRIPVGETAGALVFRPLDGNPRHGLLALYLTRGTGFHGAVEILERQGRWMVMPDTPRMVMVATMGADRDAAAYTPRSSITGTPDRRYVFFNTLLDGCTVTLVERRPDDSNALT